MAYTLARLSGDQSSFQKWLEKLVYAYPTPQETFLPQTFGDGWGFPSLVVEV